MGWVVTKALIELMMKVQENRIGFLDLFFLRFPFSVRVPGTIFTVV